MYELEQALKGSCDPKSNSLGGLMRLLTVSTWLTLLSCWSRWEVRFDWKIYHRLRYFVCWLLWDGEFIIIACWCTEHFCWTQLLWTQCTTAERNCCGLSVLTQQNNNVCKCRLRLLGPFIRAIIGWQAICPNAGFLLLIDHGTVFLCLGKAVGIYRYFIDLSSHLAFCTYHAICIS
jgi:hypothetical protein